MKKAVLIFVDSKDLDNSSAGYAAPNGASNVLPNPAELLHDAVQQPSPTSPEGEKYRLIKPAIDRLQTDFRDSALTVQALAQEAHMSEAYFRRLFRQLFGTPPMKYIIRLRILCAKELLKSGLYPVNAVAEAVGFNDTKYFGTVFKKYTGVSPADYKKNLP